MRIYLAGPMRGYKDFNFPTFFKVTEELRKKGHTVFNPAEKDIQKYGEDICKSPTGNLKTAEKKGFSLRKALKSDLTWICEHADAVALLPGWKKSKGATAEYSTAKALGLDLIHVDLDKLGNIRELVSEMKLVSK